MKGKKGFTLIELMVVLMIITILAGAFVIPGVMGASERGRMAGARTDTETLQKAIDYFVIDNEELPNRKDATTENYYTLLFTGQDDDGTALASVMMRDKQNTDNSQAGALDVTDFPVIKRDNLYNHLVVNSRSYPGYVQHGQKGPAYGWRESYLKLKGDLLDPWGNSYIVVFRDLGNNTTRVFILSAGPDKILDTDPALDTVITEDDVGITWIIRP